MKPGQIEMLVKAGTYVIVGAGTAFTAAISQWIESGTSPGKLEWAVIIVATVVAAANALKSFVSEGYGDYKRGLNGKGGGTT